MSKWLEVNISLASILPIRPHIKWASQELILSLSEILANDPELCGKVISKVRSEINVPQGSNGPLPISFSYDEDSRVSYVDMVGRLDGRTDKDIPAVLETITNIIRDVMQGREEGDILTASAKFNTNIAHGHRFSYWYEWNGHAWEGVKTVDRNTAASVAEDIYDMRRLQRNVREGCYAEAEELIDAWLESLAAMKNAYPDDKENNNE